nr:hypothetical protein BaRGS_030473 [Batillaria attramentaria]
MNEHPSYENLLGPIAKKRGRVPPGMVYIGNNTPQENVSSDASEEDLTEIPIPDAINQLRKDALDIKHSMISDRRRRIVHWVLLGLTSVILLVLLLAVLTTFIIRHDGDQNSSTGQAAAYQGQPYYPAAGLKPGASRLRDCQGAKMKQTFPDMDYALLGYNVLKGYPLAVGHDPGFTLPIFSADYSAGHMSADCTHSVPKGVVLIPDVSCVVSFSSEVVRSKRKNELTYIKFFEKFGTHFLREAKFGASYTYEYKMNSRDYKLETERGVNVAVSASYSGAFSVGAELNMDASFKASAANFQKKVTWKTITIGAPPSPSGNALEWASTVKESPVPVSYDLASIEELFTERFMAVPGMQRYAIDYRKIAERIKTTKRKYCEMLKDKGLVDDCTELTAGLTLGQTEILGNPIKIKTTSNSKCIDECSKHAGCVAVDFCVKCRQTERKDQSAYNICHMYGESFVSGGRRDDKWETTIILPELEKQVVLNNTRVVGVERSFAEPTSVRTERDCFDKCLGDLFCVAFTFCTCPTKAQKCTLYSDVRMSLVEERGTSTHFISRRVQSSSDVYT